jgi:hypothetical protein
MTPVRTYTPLLNVFVPTVGIKQKPTISVPEQKVKTLKSEKVNESNQGTVGSPVLQRYKHISDLKSICQEEIVGNEAD